MVNENAVLNEEKQILVGIAEPGIKKQVEKFLKQHRQSRREREMLEKLHQLSLAINSAIELDEILKLTCKAAVEIFNVDHSGVVLFEKSLLKGKVIAEYPPQENFVETEIPVKGIPLEEQLVYHREIINISDFSRCESLGPVQKTLIGLNIRSVLIVPVVLNGKVIASFSLDMLTRNRVFYKDEIELCKKFAGQVATAMGKARYVEELSIINRIGHDIGYAAPLEMDIKKILELVRKHAGKLIDVSNFYTAVYDEETNRYSFPLHVDEQDDISSISSEKMSRSLTDYVRRTRESLLVDHEKCRELIGKGEIEIVGTPTRVWLGAPLIARNKVLGVMAVQNYDSENAYDEDDLRLLQTIASQTAIAIDNAQLFGRIQEQRCNQVKAVRQISGSIAASVEQEEMFLGILKWAVYLIGEARLAEIWLLNRETGEQEAIATHGVKTRDEYRKIPVDQGIIGWAARHKKSVLVPDVSRDNRYLSVYEGTGSEIAVPLLKEKELIGVLNIEHLRVNIFNRDDLALAEAIAGLVVVAIENARLYEDLDHKIKDLENANKQIAATQEFLTRTTIASDFIHRLNNLAGTIPTRINMAREKLDTANPRDAEVIRQLNIIASHSESLLEAAQKIKNTEQTQAPEHLAVNELLELAVKKAMAAMQDIEKQVCIQKNFASNLQTICVDRNKLLDTLVNILLNAVEATPDAGRLILFTGEGYLGDKPCIEIGISDTGAGIPVKDLPRIFDLYFTTKKNGLGLGLWRDKNFMKGLGGDIEVKSKDGQGSTFTIKIPYMCKYQLRNTKTWRYNNGIPKKCIDCG